MRWTSSVGRRRARRRPAAAAEPSTIERRLELVADAGQQLTALIVERVTSSRASWFEIAAAHVIDARRLPRSARELPLSASVRPFPVTPGSARHCCGTSESKRALPSGWEVRTPAPSVFPRAHASHPRPVGRELRSLGTVQRHDALPIVRLSHTRQGAVEPTRLMPPCGRRAVPVTPPRGPPERQWGSKVPPRICRCAVS
jgi:hypothetical protein